MKDVFDTTKGRKLKNKLKQQRVELISNGFIICYLINNLSKCFLKYSFSMFLKEECTDILILNYE